VEQTPRNSPFFSTLISFSVSLSLTASIDSTP
jgi:hypothetical protein